MLRYLLNGSAYLRPSLWLLAVQERSCRLLKLLSTVIRLQKSRVTNTTSEFDTRSASSYSKTKSQLQCRQCRNRPHKPCSDAPYSAPSPWQVRLLCSSVGFSKALPGRHRERPPTVFKARPRRGSQQPGGAELPPGPFPDLYHGVTTPGGPAALRRRAAAEAALRLLSRGEGRTGGTGNPATPHRRRGRSPAISRRGYAGRAGSPSPRSRRRGRSPAAFTGEEAAPKFSETLCRQAALSAASPPRHTRVLSSSDLRFPSPLEFFSGYFQSRLSLGRRFIANRGGFRSLGLLRRSILHQPHATIAVNRIRPTG